MRLIDWSWLEAARLQARYDGWTRRHFCRAPGQSTVEYALVGALVVIAAAGALTILGGQLNNVFSNISKTLGAAAAGH